MLSELHLERVKTKPAHDTIVYRLAQILVKLNQGAKLDPLALAEEFGVNLRTIQRDLNVRFAYLPLLKSNGRYHLEPAFLGKLQSSDIDRFAVFAGVRGLFPSMSDEFLREIFDARTQSALLVKGHDYEDLSGQQQQFRQIELAIAGHRLVDFVYARDGGTKRYKDIEPYRLVNHKGIWYLAGKDGAKLKTFSFTKINSLIVSTVDFVPDAGVGERLEAEDGVWHTDLKQEIRLQVEKTVASYFKRRKLIANQVIEKEFEDGSLLISTQVGHVNQVLPIVRYWIPHIRIISPEGLQEELDAVLSAYLNRDSS